MKSIIYGFIFIFTTIGTVPAQAPAPLPKPTLTKIEASPSNGFSYPYFLYVPPVLRDVKQAKVKQTILVLPNNTGQIDDELKVHEDYITRREGQYTDIASQIGVIVLVPVFPRPKTDWKIYTHALDRDSLTTGKKEYQRFDLQLLAMIDHARRSLAEEKLRTDKRVMIRGFSASGMFSNRFAFLHPDRVKAAAIGSPGGWPIAPVSVFREKKLRYPIGVDDLKSVAGRGLKIKSLRKVPFFIYMGDQDDNDSVPFGDGYEEEDKELIFELFGKTPVERWEISKKLYRENKLRAEFKLYPGIKHTITKEMMADITAFLQAHK
jgi:predicted esterase